MNLIERYLAAVGRELPESQRADITAELRDVLLSQAEEREAQLGRPLGLAETEALLVAFGPPLVVAGRYRPMQHLIGPDIFPYWWAALKVVLLIQLSIYMVLVVVETVTDPGARGLARAIPSFWTTGVYVFGLVTLACVALEQFGWTRFLHRWRPRDLAPASGKLRSRFETLVEIAMGVVFIAWWMGLIHFRNLLPIPGTVRVDLAPVWSAFYWPILGYSVGEIALNLLSLARPAWVRLNAGLTAARCLIGAGILWGVLQAGHWVVVSGERLPAKAQAIMQTNFDRGLRIGVIVTIAYFVLRAAYEGWKLWRTPAIAPPERAARWGRNA